MQRGRRRRRETKKKKRHQQTQEAEQAMNAHSFENKHTNRGSVYRPSFPAFVIRTLFLSSFLFEGQDTHTGEGRSERQSLRLKIIHDIFVLLSSERNTRVSLSSRAHTIAAAAAAWEEESSARRGRRDIMTKKRRKSSFNE